MSEMSSFQLLPPDKVWKHAVATPLTTLQLALEQAENHLTSHPTAHQYLKTALAQARYLYQLLTEPQTQKVSIRELLHATKTRLDCHPQRKIILLDHLGEDLHFHVHPVEVEEALSCAVTNGWEAYQDGDQPVVIISAYRKVDQLLLQIQDFGEGMNWLTRHRLGRHQLSQKGKHRGLGSQFIRYVVEDQLHGRVIYSSYVGLGTLQTWTIPVPATDNQNP